MRLTDNTHLDCGERDLSSGVEADTDAMMNMRQKTSESENENVIQQKTHVA